MLVLFVFVTAAAFRKVCLIGGEIEGLGTTNTSECFNESTRTWELSDVLTLSDRADSLTGFNLGMIACIAGNLPFRCSNGTAPWELLPPEYYHRIGPSPIYGPNWIGLVGGGNVSNMEYTQLPTDPQTSNFHPVWMQQNITTSLHLDVDSATVIPLNGSSCLVGGGARNSAIGDPNVTSCLDPLSMKWSAGPYLITGRYGPVPLYLNGRWCVMGGKSNMTTPLNTIECVSSTGSPRFQLDALTYPVPFSEAVNVSLYGLSCFAGGQTIGDVNLYNVYCLNGSSWIPAPQLYFPRQESISVIFDSAPPTQTPTSKPSLAPTRSPTLSPTQSPTTSKPTQSPTQSPTRSPTQSPTRSPTQSPTRSPTSLPTRSPTLSPSTRAPSASPTRTPTLFPSTLAPTLLERLPTPDQGHAVVQLSINGVNLTASQALLIISQLFRQLNLTSPSDPSQVSLNHQDGSTVVSVVVSDDAAGRIDTELNTMGTTQLNLGGYDVRVSLQFPSLIVILQGLKLWHILLVCAILLLLLVLLIWLHVRKGATSHLPCFVGVSTSIFSFFSHAWFLRGLQTLAFDSGSTSRQHHALRPYFWGFLAALLLPLIANAIVMGFHFGRLRRGDPEFNLWVTVHHGSFGFAIFLGLFAIGNVAAVASPVWGSCMSAPMTRVTRASLAASGVIGSVLEVPRLAIQVTLAILFQATWAVALPLLLGSLFLMSSFLQRIYFLGYVKGEKANQNQKEAELAFFHGY